MTIGETLTDFEDQRPLPAIAIDEPSLSMTIGINTSPFVGNEGKKLTARQVWFMQARAEGQPIKRKVRKRSDGP